jgi:Protein of unknown function (DUF1549)/Protein of unknown function (DUF1553)
MRRFSARIALVGLVVASLTTVGRAAPVESKPAPPASDTKKPASGKPIKPGDGVMKPAPVVEDQHGPPRDPVPVAAAIDREIDRRLAQVGIPASPAADDAEFLRRTYLDIAGHIPSAERAAAFLDSTEPDKRRKLIDELLGSQDFGHHLADIWRNRLAPRDPGNTKVAGVDRFGPWLAEQFNRNRGWNQIATELLTAEGEVNKNPQTSFVMAYGEESQPKPNLLAAGTAKVFLGIQLQCAECHDHPFAPWKQEDFWGVAAFFGRTRNSGIKGKPFTLTEEPDPNPFSVKNGGVERPEVREGGAIVIPGTGGNKGAGKVVPAKLLGGEPLKVDDTAPLRPRLAAWLTSHENKYFARAFVNRTWAQFFGRGLVQPLDNMHDDNPPSHPEVLTLLADEFVASGYDIKHLVRCICASNAYQRTSRPLPENEKDAELFSRMAVKSIAPEALYDSLTVVLGARKSGPPGGKPNGIKPPAAKPEVVKGPPMSPRDEFIHFFRGQGDAESGEFVHGIPQFLRRLNGEMFNSNVPLVDRLTVSGISPNRAIEALYLATLSRRPTTEECDRLAAYLAKHAKPEEGYAGVLWVLLNSGEFVLNR